MLDKASVLTNVLRGLGQDGRFVCLILNGHHLWCRWLTPLCRLQTRHLSTDQFLSRRCPDRLLCELGFNAREFSDWAFTPRGDLPPYYAMLLTGLDRLGRLVAGRRPARGLVVWAKRGVLGTELGHINLRMVARAPLHVHASRAHRIPLPAPQMTARTGLALHKVGAAVGRGRSHGANDASPQNGRRTRKGGDLEPVISTNPETHAGPTPEGPRCWHSRCGGPFAPRFLTSASHRL
jgi:hypothetical protein